MRRRYPGRTRGHFPIQRRRSAPPDDLSPGSHRRAVAHDEGHEEKDRSSRSYEDRKAEGDDEAEEAKPEADDKAEEAKAEATEEKPAEAAEEAAEEAPAPAVEETTEDADAAKGADA